MRFPTTIRRWPLWVGLACIAAALDAQTTSPTLIGLSPNSIPAGSTGVTLTAVGSNFQTGAYVTFNGQYLPTTVYSSGQAVATVTGSLLAVPGSAVVFVLNPGGLSSNSLPFTIAPPAVNIVTGTLPAGAVGVTYSTTLTASGGTPPYTWTALTGLPQGLTLQPNGTISGTPTTVGTYSVTVQVFDASQTPSAKTLSLSVAPPPIAIVTDATLPAGTVGQPYNVTLMVSGGTAPYRWTSTVPPTGIRLDGAQGVLSGTPTGPGTFKFTVQVSDSGQLTVTKEFSLTVNTPPLVITTVPPLFAGIVGSSYVQTFSASGGTPPYAWSIVSGSTGGLTLDANSGTLQGTPQTAGTVSFTIQVADRAGARTSQGFSLVVNSPALTITTANALPAGTANAPYTAKFAATGGTPPYAWSILSGSVPGLAIDSTGALSGTPTAAGTFTVSVQARDSQGLTASRAFTIGITATALKLTTATQLPDTAIGALFLQAMTAAGGVPPYTWSANGLPDGLTIDSATGIIAGSPAVAGSFAFTVRVTDATRNTSVDLFHVNISLPPVPGVVLSGIPPVAGAAQQFPLQIAMAAAFPVAVTGQAILTFAPDAGAGDGTILFSTGGRTADFTIPAGETVATFSASGGSLQTGTVAGVLTVSLRLQAGGLDITPADAPSLSATIQRGAPVITAVRMVPQSDGFNVEITGYCTSREVTQAAFKFSASGGRTLQSADIGIPMDSLFNAWYQDPNSARYGSQFIVVQPFKIPGDASSVGLDSVTLTNRLGSTTSGVTP